MTVRAPGDLLPSTQEIWGESQKDVAEFMELLGLEVEWVEVPGERFLWEFNKDELNQVCQRLEIAWPIRYTRGRSLRNTGKHTLKVNKGWLVPGHFITITKSLGVKRANEITWHELAHAMQSERAAQALGPNASAKELAVAWGESPERKGKYPQPSELEANAYEQAADYWQLLRPID